MHIDIEVHQQQPAGFCCQVHIAACYLEIEGKILLLQLPEGKKEAGKWGVPAGKFEGGESPEEAAKRELFEETGIAVDPATQMQYLGALYIRKPEIDYIYHSFRVHLPAMPEVHISHEHQDYRWASAQEMEEMPLMMGAKEALEQYRKQS